MANGFPLLNIVLFNTDGDESVGAGDRYRCMDEILDSILAENYPNLFILANDKIRRPKHRKLCEKLHQNPADTPHREEAGVYYDTETNTHYDVEYVDGVELQQADDALGLEPGNDFAVSRLTACVLTPTADIEMGKILLVSWHGPWTRLGLGLLARQACFRRLVRFLELLKVPNDCDMVIVGGDFNLPSGQARNLLGDVGGALLDNYIPTRDRPANRDPIDYVVYWPGDSLQDAKVSVVMPYFRRDNGDRPFDHNIVLYRFDEIDSYSDLARQFRNMSVYESEEESED